MDASSIACREGRTVEEACNDNPSTQGCETPEPIEEPVDSEPPAPPIEPEPEEGRDRRDTQPIPVEEPPSVEEEDDQEEHEQEDNNGEEGGSSDTGAEEE
jgi:hypothetical protein